MESFSSAYARALFPRRYGPRPGAGMDGHAGTGPQPMALAPGGLEISLGAAIYRVVVAVERLMEAARRLAPGWKARAASRPGATPVGCA